MDPKRRATAFLTSEHGIFGRAVRVAVSAGLVLSLFGPLPFSHFGQSPRTAEAKNLEWGDVRPPLTDEADTNGTDGFRHLPNFGNALHAIAVAPNGDIFTAGEGGEVNANGDGDCDDATDADADTLSADGDCDNFPAPVVFKSTDGGMRWRAARVSGAGVATTIREIVVSPDYPADGFVGVVFTTGIDTDAATDLNGIAWSLDGGTTFPAANTLSGAYAPAEPDLADVLWTTAALSPDFNFSDGNGALAIGGWWVAGQATTATINATELKLFVDGSIVDVNTVNDIAETTASAADNFGDRTLSLAYSNSETPITLARLFLLNGDNTFGQVAAATWPVTAAGGGDEINDNDANDLRASGGNIAFEDDYQVGGAFFAAVRGTGGAVGGVFSFDGSNWSERTLGSAACNTGIDRLTVTGNGSTSRLIASLADSNVVCRSINEGSSWSDASADGGDSVCDECHVQTLFAVTRVANNRSNPETVYWTTTGNLGGVFRSTTSGAAWEDTGLTNQPYIVGGMDEVDATRAFATATVSPALRDAFFYTDTYGPNAGWRRSLRTTRTDLILALPSGFATHQTAFARFSSATEGVVLRTTDGGRTWVTTNADPFDASPEANETAIASSARSATTLYVGGDKGHVAVTNDGGDTWILLPKDFGLRIDEFDFSDAITFFVTALDTDNTLKVWQTRVGGATFTQVGNAPWGTGDGTIDTLVNGYRATDNTGTIMVRTAGAVSTDEVYRINIGEALWTDLDIDVPWTSSLLTSAVTVGDGFMAMLWNAVAPELFVTFRPFTGDKDDFDPDDVADAERDNLLLALPVPPLTTATSAIGTGINPAGYTLQSVTGGRVMELTMPNAFRDGLDLTLPAQNSSVPTNVGSNGTPVVFLWQAEPGADSYELAIGVDPSFSTATVFQAFGPMLVVTSADLPLIASFTYYWRVRVKMAHGAILEGPWSLASFFQATAGAGGAAGALQFSATSFSANEHSGTSEITVTRTGGSSGAVGVTAATTVGGSATAGADYTATSVPLSWGAGDSTPKTFNVPILTDAQTESPETVNLLLSSPTGGATLGAFAGATLTIVDDGLHGPYAPAVMADSPVGYWRLNESSGTLAADSSSAGNNGTYMNGVTLGAQGALMLEPAHTAISLDGVNDFVRIPDSASLSPTATISVEAWVNVSAYSGNYPRLVSKPGAYELTMYTMPGAEGRLEWKLSLASGDVLLTTAAADRLLLGQWYHVAATYDGAMMRIFLNGVQEASRSATGALDDSTAALTVSHGTRAVAARMDEVAVYSTALSSARIRAHYEAAVPPPSSPYPAAVLADNPAAYWRLNGAGGAAVDSSGKGNGGTLFNGVMPGQSGALLSESDAAVQFDGVNDYIRVPDSVSLSPTAAVSVETWVYLTAYSGNYPRLVSKPGAYELTMYTMPGAEGRLEWKVARVAGDVVLTTAFSDRLQLGQWYHVVATYDGTNMRVFINGVQKATRAAGGALKDSTAALTLSANDRALAAKLDEVAVYGTALPLLRAQAHHAAR